MNMKKRLFGYAAMVALSLSLTTFTACSDDNDGGPASPTIDQEITQRGITTDMQSAIVELPVQCEGRWYAAIDPDCDWADIVGTDGILSGNQTLSIQFDENRTGIDRKTVLYLTDRKGNISEIAITQTALYKGQAPTNGSGPWFAANGVGCGIDYRYVLDPTYKRSGIKFEPTKVKLNNNLFNFAKIEALQSRGDLQDEAYTETPLKLADLEACLIDSLFCQNKYLNASLTLECSFGFLEFAASGSYESTKKESKAYIDYNVAKNAPTYNVVLSPAEIVEFAESKAEEELPEIVAKAQAKQKEVEELTQQYYKLNGKQSLTKKQRKVIDKILASIEKPSYGDVFSTYFSDMYYQLWSAVVEEDDETADKVLSALDAAYGPFFISGGDFGGNLNIYAQVDTMALDGKASLSAEAEANIAGAIGINGHVEFSEEGLQVFRNSHIKIGIYGGSASRTQGELLDLFTGENMNNRGRLQEILSNWATSLEGDTDEGVPSQAAPIRFIITPIWTLFGDVDVRQYAEDYFIKMYADRGMNIYLGIAGGEETDIEDLISKNCPK